MNVVRTLPIILRISDVSSLSYLGIGHAGASIVKVSYLRLLVARHACGVADVQDRVTLGLKLDALVLAGQEPTVPLPCCDRLGLTAFTHRREHDESGQIVALASQAV